MIDDAFDSSTELFRWAQDCSLILYSDGLADAQSERNVDFGKENIIDSILGSGSPHQSLKDAVLAHLGGHDANDDISIATITLHETGN